MDLTIHILGFALLYIGFRMEEHAVRLMMSEVAPTERVSV